jgi:hypothetical protein
MASRLLASLTGQSVVTSVSAPASTNARRSPNPLAVADSPMPLSHAESVTSFVPRKFSADASSAVRMPSSGGPCFRLAPASASPDRSNGFSAWRGRKNPCDAI